MIVEFPYVVEKSFTNSANSDIINNNMSNKEKAITNETVGTGDGTTTVFVLANKPIKPESDVIKIDGIVKTRGTDYVINNETGEITFAVAPANGSVITADYLWYFLRNKINVVEIDFIEKKVRVYVKSLTDEERTAIEECIDSGIT